MPRGNALVNVYIDFNFYICIPPVFARVHYSTPSLLRNLENAFSLCPAPFHNVLQVYFSFFKFECNDVFVHSRQQWRDSSCEVPEMKLVKPMHHSNTIQIFLLHFICQEPKRVGAAIWYSFSSNEFINRSHIGNYMPQL